MALVTMRDLLTKAGDGHYAVGYFESWNLESTLAVMDAAERLKSPVIIGISGAFLADDNRIIEENIYHYGALLTEIARTTTLPVSLLVNESHKLPLLVQGLKAGFNAVMYQDSRVSFEDTVSITKYLTKTAHFVGADVEAEVGELPNVDVAKNEVSEGALTDPDQARRFVDETDVDALAVAVGNVHTLEGEKSVLKLDLIRELRKVIPVPLVLHGGTGIAEDSMKQAIELGMCKVNVGTVLKRVYLDEIKQYYNTHDLSSIDIHDIIGKGGRHDVFSQAREAVAAKVMELIKLFGSDGKAVNW